jgi:hypothetical protein
MFIVIAIAIIYQERIELNPEGDPTALSGFTLLFLMPKTLFLGIYHSLDSLHIQFFPDEFCFRFNRRSFPTQLFNRIVTSVFFSVRFPILS